MNLKEKFKDFVDYTCCEKEILVFDNIVEQLKASKLKNIAVLGETNCGKTELINKLSGKEVRPATRRSLGENPLMVTFGSEETKEGFEKVNVDTEEEYKKGIALYEIPINVAIDYESRVCNMELETMDAVIYVISAIQPFTASDVENLKVITNKFPLIIYISKTEMLDNDEYDEIIEYIKNEFKNAFNDVCGDCEFYDGKTVDCEKTIMSRFSEISIDEIREFHIGQVEYAAKDMIDKKLDAMLDNLSKKRKERNAEVSKAKSLSREKALEWDKIHIDILDKEHETIEYANKEINLSKIRAKNDLMACWNSIASKNKRYWANHELKSFLESKINKTASDVVPGIGKNIKKHMSEIIDGVNKRFDKKILFEEMDNSFKSVNVTTGLYGEEPDRKKTYAAVGSAVVAGGVIFSGLSFIPTFIIAVPALGLAAKFTKDSIDESKEYNDNITRQVKKCFEDNYNRLTKELCSNINRYYEKIESDIISLSEEEESTCTVNFDDINEKENQIKNKKNELKKI